MKYMVLTSGFVIVLWGGFGMCWGSIRRNHHTCWIVLQLNAGGFVMCDV